MLASLLSLLNSSCTLDAKITNLDQIATSAPSDVTYTLHVASQPTNATSMAPIGPTVQVELRTLDNQIAKINAIVYVQIQTNPSGAATLSGTQSVQSTDGVAIFNDLAIDIPDSNYSLKFYTDLEHEVVSTGFNIIQQTLAVTPLYPSNGANWMDYVAKNDPTLAVNEFNDSACVSNGYPNCVHGGEMRKVEVSGFTSCASLSMSDSLIAFDWVCYDKVSPIYFYSKSFKSKKGLRDLIAATDFLDNKVTLKKNTHTIGESALSKTWWTNPVVAVILNSGGADPVLSLNSAGTIYTISGSGQSRGFDVDADKIALVTLSSATLSNTATISARDCLPSTGFADTCLVWIKNNFGWLEGNFSLNIVASLVRSGVGSLSNSYGWRIHNSELSVNNAASYGIANSSTYLYTTDTKIVTSGSMGIYGTYGKNAYFRNIQILGGAYGIFVGGQAWYNTFDTVEIVNSTTAGLSSAAWHTTLINSKISNSENIGVELAGSSNHVQNSILSNNDGNGLYIGTGNSTIVRSNLILNNGGIGLNLALANSFDLSIVHNNIIFNNLTGVSTNSVDSYFTNNLITNNDTGIAITATSTDNVWSKKLILGNTTNCSITSTGLNPGLTGADCDNQGLSNSTKVLGVTVDNYFEGPANTDSVNVHTTALAVASTITDWLNFENIFRIWSIDGNSFNSSVRSKCTGAASCRIFDFRLSGTATEALAINGTATPNQPCPASIHGDVYFQHGIGTGGYALENASELMNDVIGNENGLCESYESCYFNSNAGVYQGMGDLTKTCVFENGSKVTDVKMYFY